MNKRCPRCKSTNIKIVKYMEIDCILCNDCGYDERESYEVYPSEKKSQKEKSHFSPYKTGGSKRTL